MANLNTDTFQSSANLSLWFKVRAGDPLNLADVPEIIPLRWSYFRDNWNFLQTQLLSTANKADNPDYFRATVNDLTAFVNQQRLNTTDNNPFSGNDVYYRFYPVFDAMLIENIDLTNEEQRLIADKQTQVQSFSKNDFLRIKADITTYRDHLADFVGLSDPDYNRIYNRGAVVSQVEPDLEDVNLMLILQRQLSSVDFILANLFAVDAAVDPFALAKANANNPDVNIGQYNSGYLVKLHFGEDLEGLATRYLKDPNRWIDIALANGLKEPYIDEIGESISLMSNARGNQINISSIDTSGNANINKLHVNQFVTIQSNSVTFPSQRVITSIREVPVSGEIVLTLNGDSLDAYLLSDQASIRVFKSNTINSSQYILIPSTQSLPNNRQDEIPWFLTSSAADERRTKVDIAIDDKGSLLFAANGDIGLSYGLANAFQAIRLKLLTEQGSNRYHPNFGTVNLTGSFNIPGDARRQIIQSITSQIQADRRFDRLESISVEQSTSGPIAYTINLTVRLAGGGTVIPISFSVAT
jgi:hypothetical protein